MNGSLSNYVLHHVLQNVSFKINTPIKKKITNLILYVSGISDLFRISIF